MLTVLCNTFEEVSYKCWKKILMRYAFQYCVINCITCDDLPLDLMLIISIFLQYFVTFNALTCLLSKQSVK